MSTETKVGQIQIVRTKPRSVPAVQYTGKNGSVVAEFAKKLGVKVRRSASWLKLSLDGNEWVRVEVGDLIVANPDTKIMICDQNSIKQLYTIPKGVELL